jgi:RNA polymerase sigma factor (TIGR02999 family)
MVPPAESTAELLVALRRGDRAALDRLVPQVYRELHRIAHRELARRRGGEQLRTTGLVHEAYLKLVAAPGVDVEDRAHFFAVAATAMRRIVIDQARRMSAQKRGGQWHRVTLDDEPSSDGHAVEELIELDEALHRLGHFDERLCSVVECRFFCGMSIEETADALGVSPRTVDRAWQKAKAWLAREIDEA